VNIPRGETRFHGLPISGGVRLARVCLFRLGNEDIPDYEVSGEGVAQEKQRLARAKAFVAEHLEALQKVVAGRIGPAEAEIFAAHAALLADPAIDAAVTCAIEEGHNAEQAVFRAFDEFRARLVETRNPLLRERAADLDELKRRLLDVLCDINPAFRCASEPQCQRGHARIIITEELTPSVALELDTSEVVGIVTARGGITSHAAILARAAKAEGIGLYRTELEFTAAGRLLSEDEQLDRYGAVVKAMDGHAVYFRLLDIGGDKPSPLFDFPCEENPSLGLRGARFLLARPDLLRAQARALARLSALRPVHVMYPMIVDLDQYRRLRQLFDEVTADVPRGRIYHGVMFEIPSACLQAREILEEVDFASVGTNDLVQYLFAVDRNNEAVAGDYSPDRPVFWRLLEDLARAAADAAKPLSICGEMAASPAYTHRLMELGIQTLSVSARHIPVVRRAAREAFASR
jgi:phosphoenolpyruvate-protein kinase (PTS system EI component)